MTNTLALIVAGTITGDGQAACFIVLERGGIGTCGLLIDEWNSFVFSLACMVLCTFNEVAAWAAVYHVRTAQTVGGMLNMNRCECVVVVAPWLCHGCAPAAATAAAAVAVAAALQRPRRRWDVHPCTTQLGVNSMPTHGCVTPLCGRQAWNWTDGHHVSLCEG